MIRRAAIRVCWSCGLFAAAATALVATDEKAEVSAIQEVKREFDTIKDTVKPLGVPDSRKALPSINGIDTPTIMLLPETPAGRAGNPFDEKKARRSQNWLVEAMMKDPEKGRDSNKLKSGKDELGGDEDGLNPMERLIVQQLRGDDVKKPQDAAQELRVQDELKNSVVNPLNDFMATWISSRDRDLLLGDQLAGKADSSFKDIRLLNAQTSNNSALAGLNLAGAETTRKENPYLNLPDLNSRQDAPVASTPDSARYRPITQPAATAPTFTEQPAEPRRSKDTMPAPLAKPEEDARYFPQLKRF